ncbi:hypothetical protein TorRG33x02_253260 [Trema orientale]|uniref:Uncharacterized protein n=1 Tax=Trema orientale TaxID=63057 RepID=A0A2P5DF23_TREOI|nr:hypothetical protein TorRG33x02_253260 [Trema orientale]
MVSMVDRGDNGKVRVAASSNSTLTSAWDVLRDLELSDSKELEDEPQEPVEVSWTSSLASGIDREGENEPGTSGCDVDGFFLVDSDKSLARTMWQAR